MNEYSEIDDYNNNMPSTSEEEYDAGIDYVIEAIVNSRRIADESREGSVVDLCNVLLKVVWEYRAQGRSYMLARHWED